MNETHLFQGHCWIGKDSVVEDGEIHAIQEGLAAIKEDETIAEVEIVRWLANQNALQALAAGPSTGRDYLDACLEDLKELQQSGCKIKRKWNPSHNGSNGNKQADTLAKSRLKGSVTCPWERSTHNWLQAQPGKQFNEQWQARFGRTQNPSGSHLPQPEQYQGVPL